MPDIDTALRLRAAGALTESNLLLVALAAAHPQDGAVQYQCAWSFDILSLERQAISYYEKALALGLSEKEMRGAYLGLGSTHRVLGNYRAAQDVFLRGLARFPQDHALSVFYAMTLHNLGCHAQAVQRLLLELTDTSADEGIQSYAKAIRFYAQDVDATLPDPPGDVPGAE
ncbi:MAG: tetratricopeptide repeat protein [Candidatus Limiplasma sp.]|nr:tetratricopeptide repeat protein [Candidatus Limiplasma sp.]MEA5144976.1 tetratricopeptide repeat protein [Candidatus Limiplasma sp.]